MIGTYLNEENLYIMGTLTTPGIPCSYFVADYFKYSKNNFMEIKDNHRLYDGVKKEFTHYCKTYFPELYKLFCETKEKDNMINCFDCSSVTFDVEYLEDDYNYPGWEKYNIIVNKLIDIWNKNTKIY